MKSEKRPTAAVAQPRRPVRASRLAVVFVIIVFLSLIGWLAWQRFAPVPPLPEFAGMDPEVVEAISDARSKVLWWPWSAERWGQLGMVLYAHELNNDALDCLKQAEDLDPADVRWPYYQGRLLLSERPNEAVPCFQRAMALKPDDTTWQRLADGLMNQDRIEEAEAVFRQMLQRNPANPRATLGLGQVAVRKSDWRGAVTHLSRVTGSPEVRKAAYRLLAEAQQHLGETQAAATASQRYVALPDDPPMADSFDEAVAKRRVGVGGRMTRATSLLGDGRPREAISLLEETVQKYPQYLYARLLLGRTYLQQNDWPKAEQHLREAIRLEPNSTAAHVDLGRIAQAKGLIRDALGHYREAVRLKPDAFTAHYRIGECLLRLGDKPGALRAFQEVVRIEPDLAEAQVHVGSLLHDAGNDAEAVQHLNYALRLSPDHPAAKRLLDEIKGK